MLRNFKKKRPWLENSHDKILSKKTCLDQCDPNSEEHGSWGIGGNPARTEAGREGWLAGPSRCPKCASSERAQSSQSFLKLVFMDG